MGFFQAVGHGFAHYADFNGRARRSEYWFWTLFILLVSIVAFVTIAAATDPNPKADSTAPGMIALALIGFYLITFLPNLAVTVRRLHDSGKTGWWYLISFLPFGSFVLLAFMFLDSQPGDNAYGPSPKAGGPRPGYTPAPEDNWATRLADDIATRHPGPAPAAASATAYARNTRPVSYGHRTTFGQRHRAPG